MKRLTDYTWQEYSALGVRDKAECLARPDGMPLATIFAQQFGRDALDRLCDAATKIRSIAKSRSGMEFLRGLLFHKRAMIYFTQPSSRTFLSFLSACQILGIETGEVRDASVSSEFKGESREDSIRTFSSYFDLIVMRTREKGLAERMAWALAQSRRPVPVINAGSGKDQHPTQALLDVYTLQRSFERRGGLRGLTVVYVVKVLSSSETPAFTMTKSSDILWAAALRISMSHAVGSTLNHFTRKNMGKRSVST